MFAHALFLDPCVVVIAEASGSGELQLPDFGSDNKPNKPPAVARVMKNKACKEGVSGSMVYEVEMASLRLFISALKGGMLKRSVGNVKDSAFLFFSDHAHGLTGLKLLPTGLPLTSFSSKAGLAIVN